MYGLSGLIKEHLIYVLRHDMSSVERTYRKIVDVIFDFDYSDTIMSYEDYDDFLDFLDTYDRVTHMFLNCKLETYYYIVYTDVLRTKTMDCMGSPILGINPKGIS
jgi:hypothetical protein